MRTATVHAPAAMVASVDHLATGAGVAILRAGGSAADAAIAASAVLAVTAPHLCGMGGDLFALVHDPTAAAGSPPAVVDAAGRAGSGADADRLRGEGHERMPFRGDIRSSPVPGCVDGWLLLHQRFGVLPLADVLGPAIGYAGDGFPASPLLAVMAGQLTDIPGAGPLATAFAAGEFIRRPGVAAALGAVVDHGREGFYLGEFGEGLLRLGRRPNGSIEFDRSDLEEPLAAWAEPLGAEVWGHQVWTVPPVSQGYLTLLGCLVAAGLALPADSRDPAWPHLLVEAARAAGHDRLDVLHDGADVRRLLADDEVARRRGMIDPGARSSIPTGAAPGGTMYLCAVDSRRMGVSFIQSNASGFGSHVFEPTTGIGLHNRGIGFSLEPGHVAEYGPGRRPPHTLSPALVTTPDGTLRGVIGTMGGDSQPQILLQLLARWLRDGWSPGEVIGAPRWSLAGPDLDGFSTWRHPEEVRTVVEDDGAARWADGLRARGHTVDVEAGVMGGFGHAQMIEVTPGGVLAGAADPRALISQASGY